MFGLSSLKFYAIGGAILIALGLWGAVKYYRAKSIAAEQRAVVGEKTVEVLKDVEKRQKEVDKLDDDGLLDYWHSGVSRPDQTGPAAPAPQANPGKPDPGLER